MQPVLERLRNGARGYSADERLDGNADPIAFPEVEFVVVPERRFPFAALAAFAGGASAIAALAFAYVVFGTSGGGGPVAAAQPSAPPAAAAQVSAAPAKITARLAPNQPVSSRLAAQPAQTQVASADATAAVPVDTSKSDRLDASANPSIGAAYDPLQSPLSLWSLSPTQAAIEGTDPALAAPTAPPAAAPAAAAAPPLPQQATHEHHATPTRHHVRSHRRIRRVHHARHYKPATTGEAASAGGAQNAAAANGGDAAQPTATKKFLGLFGG